MVEILLTRSNLGPFNTAINILAFIGVIIHELSHFIMCKLTGVKTNGIQIKYRYYGMANPHGAVRLDKYEYQKISFMQALLVSLAPLYISTWLFFFSLGAAFDSTIDPLFRLMAAFLCVSLFLKLTPSPADFSQIRKGFNRDSSFAIYQIFLVFLSGSIILIIMISYNIGIPFDFLYYIFVGFTYLLLYYVFKVLGYLIHSIRTSTKQSSTLNFKAYTRRKVRRSRPYKLGIEEAQW